MNAHVKIGLNPLNVTDRSQELLFNATAILDLIRCVDSSQLRPDSLDHAAAAAQSMLDELGKLNGL